MLRAIASLLVYSGLTMLDQHQGDLEAALAESVAQEYGGTAMGSEMVSTLAAT